MRSCPNCRSNYTDDTLVFCLQDGTELVDASISKTEFPTVAFGEKTERFTTNKDAGQIRFDLQPNDQSAGNQSRETQITSVQTPVQKSNTMVVVLSTVIGMLLLFGAIGFGGWLYFSQNQSVISRESDEDVNRVNAPTPSVELTNEPFANERQKRVETTTPTAEAMPTIDSEASKSEVYKNIFSWKSASEAHDLTAHMEHYADKLDYYNKNGVSKSFVRSDRLKAYDKFPLIKITLSNVNIMPGSASDNMTAVFDKEWLFQNDQKKSTGKVKSQLKLSKIDGRWKITSEKDLKVYFVN